MHSRRGHTRSNNAIDDLRVVEDPKESRKIFLSDIVERDRVGVRRPSGVLTRRRWDVQLLAENLRFPLEEVTVYPEYIILDLSRHVAKHKVEVHQRLTHAMRIPRGRRLAVDDAIEMTAASHTRTYVHTRVYELEMKNSPRSTYLLH